VPRKVREVPLNNRTNRARLAPAGKPYFRLIEEGLHLGYRRPATTGRPGAWVGRRRRADGGYETDALGSADDVPGVVAGVQPDGSMVRTFEQAQTALRAWARGRAAAERLSAETGLGAPTVRSAVEAYLAERQSAGPAGGTDARLRLGRHVLAAPLADVKLHALTEAHLSQWRAALVQGGRRKKDAPPLPLAPATLKRLMNDLRAALRGAGERHRLDLAAVLRGGMKAPRNADVARALQILSDADVCRVVEAARGVDQDFGALVLLLATTGARFDQLARATVADFQPEQGRLMVPASRKGRGQKKKLWQPIPLAPDVVAALRPLVDGRAGTAPLLTRWHNKKVTPTAANGFRAWERDGRRGWLNSSEVSRPWRLTIVAAGLPSTFVPYSLRHSSVVRALKAGVPVRIVAAAHDTSIAMIEKHYAAHIVDASEELMRRAMMQVAPAPVAPLGG
jgi:integrase